jgi:hypothetical protein
MSIRFDNRSGDRPPRGRRRPDPLVFWAVAAGGVIVVWMVLIFAVGVGGETGVPEEVAQSGQQEGFLTESGGKEGLVDEEGTAISSHPLGSEPDYAAPENPEEVRREESVRDRENQGEASLPEGGAANEPASYDPLGISEQDIPLTPADEERVRAAAAQFVTAAYGYTGEAGEEGEREYLAGISDHALTPEFYASPGAREVERYAGLVRESGTRSAAKLERFEIEEVVPEERVEDGYTQQRVTGYAYFRTADEYNRYGEIEGEERSYRQRLTLERYRTVFKVYSAEEIEEVREP